jgi:hypothetical protein
MSKKQDLDPKEAKAIIKTLLKKRKDSLEHEEFAELFSLAMEPQNRKALLLADVHIVLSEYHQIHRNSPSNLLVILKLANFLAEEILCNFPLSVNGKFLPSILKFLDSLIDKELPEGVLGKLSDEQLVRDFLFLRGFLEYCFGSGEVLLFGGGL